MEEDMNGHQANTGSASESTVPETIMTSITSTPTPTTSTAIDITTNARDTTTSATTKAITMDGYRKRALERQREQEKQKKHQKTEASTPSTVSVHPHTPAGPGKPPSSEDHQQPADKAINHTFAEASAGASTKAGGAAASANGHHHQHHHRKAPSSQAPRTTSPPTPVSGGSVSIPSHKSVGPKGPKAIHAIELIRIAGEILQFPPATIGTSLIYYHKYRAYLHQAYKRGERDNEATKADEYLFATACLHLACKCTEVSRKVRDLVNVTYRVMNPNQPVLSLSTATKPEDNSTTLDSIPPLSNNANQQQPLIYPTAPPPTAQTYWTIRDSLLTTELMLLRILQFDLDVALPFSDVLRIYKGMGMVFAPTDDEAAQIYPDASNFDVFLPSLHHQYHRSHTGSSSSTPNKHGTPSSTSSATLLSSLPNAGPHLAPHIGIHPTLSALVQISITFCIDALCSSTIALNSSSRALAMGAIYLAIRSTGLELPLPFEDWCYAWGRPMIAAGFGIPAPGGGGGGPAGGGGYGMGLGGSIGGSSTGGASGVSGGGVNGLLGLATTNLFVSSPRPQQGEGGYMDGLELSNEPVGGSLGAGSGGGGGSGSSAAASATLNGNDPNYSQNDSPQLLSNTLSPALLTGSAMDGLDGPLIQPPQPMTIVDEVRKVVQELGSFYTH